MNPFKIIQDVFSQETVLGLYLTCLIIAFSVASFFLSKLLNSPNGRAEIWYALSEDSFRKKLARIGAHFFASGFFSRRSVSISRRETLVYVPSGQLVSLSILVCFMFVAIAPWMNDRWASDASLASVTFGGYASSREQLYVFLFAILLTFSQIAPNKILSLALRLVCIFGIPILVGVSSYTGASSAVTGFVGTALFFAAVSPSALSGLCGLLIYMAPLFVYRSISTPLNTFDAIDRTVEIAGAAILVSLLAASWLVQTRDVFWRGLRSSFLLFLSLVLAGAVNSTTPFDFGVFIRGIFATITLFEFTAAACSILFVFLLTEFDERRSWIVAMVAIPVITACSLMAFYEIGLGNWGRVILVVQYAGVAATLCWSSLVALIVSINFAEFGFRQGHFLGAAIADILVSTIAVFGSFAAILFVLAIAEARPGVPYVSPEAIITELSAGDSGHTWLIWSILLPSAYALIHLLVASLASTSLMPKPVRRYVSSLLENDETKPLGHERALVALTLSTWIAITSITALFVVYVSVFFVLGEITGLGRFLADIVS